MPAGAIELNGPPAVGQQKRLFVLADSENSLAGARCVDPNKVFRSGSGDEPGAIESPVTSRIGPFTARGRRSQFRTLTVPGLGAMWAADQPGQHAMPEHQGTSLDDPAAVFNRRQSSSNPNDFSSSLRSRALALTISTGRLPAIGPAHRVAGRRSDSLPGSS